MRSAARTGAVVVPALAVVSLAWLRLEEPVAPLWRVAALVALALAASAPRRPWLRAAGAVVASVAATRIAVGVDLVPRRILDPGSGFGVADSFAELGARFGNGFSDFYGTHLPFDPRLHVAMGELVLAGIFIFSLAVALFASARRPVASALALLVGAGWPATLLGPSRGIAMGAATLAAALVVLAGLGSRRVPALALPVAALVAAGAVAVGSATAARHGLVHWQSWNLAHAAGGPVGLGFVWNAQYGGLHWPAHPTVVLRVQSLRTPSYLRAAVLDDFVGDAWSIGVPRPADALEPAAALQPGNETREVVTVEGLADTRLVGGSIPVRFAAGAAPLEQPERGFASLQEVPPAGFRYEAWSYTARPTVAELLRSPADYPPELKDEGLMDVGRGLTLPPFGTPHRSAAVLARLSRYPDLNTYVPLARLAEVVAGSARTPYEAVARLEHWFLAAGGFRYSNQPDVIDSPLVGFVTQTRAGYCQYFAGAMALMLRYLGVPARVAVGFAGGTYDSSRHAWLVTDRDAHAWVEVWFKGYGWLPFDPTPAAAGAAHRPAPAGADVTRAIGDAPYPGISNSTPPGELSPVEKALLRKNGIGSRHVRGASAASTAGAAGTGGGGVGRGWPVLLLLLVLSAAGGAVALAKAGYRLSRRMRRDPRRAAAACRDELAAFIVDQRVEVPQSTTLTELGELVRQEFGVEPDPFVAAVTAARYGPIADADSAAGTAWRELRNLLAGARRSLTRGARLRGLLSLRSLTRAAAVDRSAFPGGGTAEGTGA